MFQPKNSSVARSSAARSSFQYVLLLLLVAMLTAGSAYATDPIDIDPDPDLTSMQIVVDLEEVDLSTLPPGRHLIFVISDRGEQTVYEFVVLADKSP